MSGPIVDPAWVPAAPHDPGERVVVADAAGWQVRVFCEAGTMHRYFAPRGFLHLQLWHPEARCSVLSPSRVSAGLWDVQPAGGLRSWRKDWAAVEATLLMFGVPGPGPARIRALQQWLVARHEPGQIRLLRLWWHDVSVDGARRPARPALRASTAPLGTEESS